MPDCLSQSQQSFRVCVPSFTLFCSGDVSVEEARWRDVAELKSGAKPQYQLQQELAAAVNTKQQELEDLLRVSGNAGATQQQQQH